MAHLSHWHILGAGSIGCLLGFYLRKAGHQVTFIQKQASLSHSISVNCKIGEHNYRSALMNTCHASTINIPITHLLICVKAYDTEKAITPLRPLLAKNACIVLLQNGMGNAEVLAQLLPHNNIYTGTTTEAARSLGRFSIEHTGHGITLFGQANSLTHKLKTDQNHSEELLDHLACALPMQWHNDITSALWQKLVVNCCINPLTAIYQCNNGALADNAEAQTIMQQIISECIAVAHSQHQEHALNNIQQHVNDVIKKTALNTSSMRQDCLNKRRTEIDYINGYIQRLGLQQGIATPINDIVIEKINRLLNTNDI